MKTEKTKAKKKSPTIGALMLRIQALERELEKMKEAAINLQRGTIEAQDKADSLQIDTQRMRSFLDEWTKQHVNNLHQGVSVRNEGAIVRRLDSVEQAAVRLTARVDRIVIDLPRRLAAAIVTYPFDESGGIS